MATTAATRQSWSTTILRHRLARVWETLGWSGTLAAITLTVIVLAAILAPWIAPYDPSFPDLANALSGSSPQHLLGTDALGRDLLSRLIYGARITLLGPTLVIVISTTIGTLLAITAAWRGGLTDAVISRVLDLMFAVPGIIFALVTVAVIGPGLTGVVVGLAIGYTPYVARVVRGAALRERNLPYVSAAWVQGRSGLAISTRHLLPNLRTLIVAQSVAALGFAVMDLAAVSFLGLGVQPPTADWGLMVKSGLDSLLRGYPMEALSAGIMIIVLVASVNVLADRLVEESGDRT